MSVVDIVAHEWAHAFASETVLSHRSNFIEAFCDIVGETVELLLPANHDDTSRRRSLNDSCRPLMPSYNSKKYRRIRRRLGQERTPAVRWRVGELSVSGVARDLYQPECKQHPRFVNDVESGFVCSRRSVNVRHQRLAHYRNAIVLSHAFALFVDGWHGADGVGLDVAFHVTMRAFLLDDSDDDFRAMRRRLLLVCESLAASAITLPPLALRPSPSIVVRHADCAHLRRVIERTRLDDISC